jgi:DNA-binding NtrC family response regulator
VKYSTATDRDKKSNPLIGQSAWVRHVHEEIRAISPYSSSVLIAGPSGTGKELTARAIHSESPRSDQPFIAVNCAAISGTLFESHMFGHVQGAFTDAIHESIGCFRAADGGTILLDEFGELEPEFQVKLLRVLQERSVTPVGSHKEYPIDVRIIAATNQNLLQLVSEGRFRQDLYYRVAVVSVSTLPLAARIEDIEVLSKYFVSTHCVQFGLPYKPISSGALTKLEQHSWPGNVRELQNVLERAVMLSHGEAIEATDIVTEQLESNHQSPAYLPDTLQSIDSRPLDITPHAAGSVTSEDSSAGSHDWPTLEEIERRHLQETLDHTGCNQAQAARLLGIDRSVLRRRIRKYGLNVSESVPGRPRVHFGSGAIISPGVDPGSADPKTGQ